MDFVGRGRRGECSVVSKTVSSDSGMGTWNCSMLCTLLCSCEDVVDNMLMCDEPVVRVPVRSIFWWRRADFET